MNAAQVYEMATAGKRVPAMEGVRGFAVLLVFLVHYNQLFGSLLPRGVITQRLFTWAEWAGHSGVDLFFVLSGFLIYGVVRSGKMAIPAFLGRRVQRIYPAFLVVLAAYAGCLFFMPSQTKLPHGAGHAAIYLLENALLLPGLFPIEPIITVAWSLSYEIFYYLALPGLYWTARMGRWSRRSRVVFFIALTILYSAYCASSHTTRSRKTTIDPADHVRLIMFVSGILVYEAMSEPSLKLRVGPRFEASAAALVILALIALPATRGRISAVAPALLLFVAFGSFVFCCLARPAGALARRLSFTPLRWLGNMSYSYYLTHAALLHAVIYCVPVAARRSSLAMWALLPPSLAITWAGATVLFVCVEKPLSFSAARRTRSDLADQIAPIAAARGAAT